MKYFPAQASLILDQIPAILQDNAPAISKLQQVWMMLLHAHNACLMHDVRRLVGDKVFSGPFKGMQMPPSVFKQILPPHLLGSYEHELHPAFERVIAGGYKQILNIGCSFGYYSVGLARRMPQVMMHAFDTDTVAQQQCQEMAALNGVSDRVKVAGGFRGEDFAAYAGDKTLVLMDIEGAEMGLLDPARYPALQKMDVIVELHDCNDPIISKTIPQRFAATHEVEIVKNRGMLFPFNDLFGPEYDFDLLDSFVATYEMRVGATPWAVMWKK